MPDHLHFILRTERGATEPVEIRCSCDDFWSVAQQRAMEELYARKYPVQPGVLDLRRASVRIIPLDPRPDPRLMSGSCRQGMLDELRTLARLDG